MSRRYGVTKTGRAIDILVIALWLPLVIQAAFASFGIFFLAAIGGYLVLAAATITLIVIGARAWGAPRYITWVAAVAGGAVSLAALNNVAATTSDSGKLHVLAIGIWLLGGIIGLVNFHPRNRDEESVYDVADRTRAGRKGSKALIVLVVIGLAMAGVIFGFSQARAAVTPHAQQLALDLKAGQSAAVVLGGDGTLAGDAAALDETIADECFSPQVNTSLALTETATQADAEALDASSAHCQGIGVKNSGFVERVEGVTDFFIGLVAPFQDIVNTVTGNVTDKTVEQLEQGDIEQAVRDLYAGVENGEVQ
jgi:hypothetical protein